LIADQRETKGMYSVKSIFLAGTFNIEMLAVLYLISVILWVYNLSLLVLF